MKVDYLPKLLLQHDDSPWLTELDLIKASQNEKLVYCVHPRGVEIAIALGQRLVLLRSTTSPSSEHDDWVRFITPTAAPEAITAIAWLWSASSNDTCLAVGTSHGFLQLHSAQGALLHRQELHDTAVSSIFMRWSGSGIDPGDAAEEITLSFCDAAVRIPAYDIWPVVRWNLRAAQGDRWWGQSVGHTPQLTPTKWEFRNIGPRSATAVVGPSPPASLTSLLSLKHEPHKLLLFTAGYDPPFALFSVDETATGGLVSMMTSIASASAAGVFKRAKSFLPGGTSTSSANSSNSNSKHLENGKLMNLSDDKVSLTLGGKKREKTNGMSVSHSVSVWDEKRRVNDVVLSPCCRWAACCDSLGRIMIVDVVSCVVLHLLKGYREAQVAWFVPTVAAAGTDSSTCLVVYAPRRGVIEVWRPHAGVRLGSLQVLQQQQQHGVLLQQPALPVVAVAGQAHTPAWRRFQPNRCWMLDLKALEIDELTVKLNQLMIE